MRLTILIRSNHHLFFRHGAGQLKIMFIGGPNQRKDYHIEEGEEVGLVHIKLLAATAMFNI